MMRKSVSAWLLKHFYEKNLAERTVCGFKDYLQRGGDHI